jgi:hypothetical protein
MSSRRESLGSVTPAKGFYAKGWRIWLSAVTLRIQRSRTSVPACMTSPRENTPHIQYSGHTMSTDRAAQSATRDLYMYCLTVDTEWVSQQITSRKLTLAISLQQLILTSQKCKSKLNSGNVYYNLNGKTVKQSLYRPWGPQEVGAPTLKDNRHSKVIRLSALRTGRLYLPWKSPGTHFCYRLSGPQGHTAARRIMSSKNSNETLRNRNRDLPACSTVSQPTAPPRALTTIYCTKFSVQNLVYKIYLPF